MIAQINAEALGRLIFSVALVIVLYLVAAALRRLIHRRVEEPQARLGLSYVVNYVALAIGVILLAAIWLQVLGGFSVAIGLVAAGAAFSLQEVVTSVAGWLMIISGQAYRIGDRIELGGIKGDVIGYGVLSTTLLELDNWIHADQETGRTVVVGNSAIVKQPLYNYSRYFSFIWDELDVLVAASTDWKRAREICLTLVTEQNAPILAEAHAELERMAQHFLIPRTEIHPSVYISLDGSVVTIAMRYLTPVRQRRRTRDELTRSVLSALEAAGDIQLINQVVTVRRPATPDQSSQRPAA